MHNTCNNLGSDDQKASHIVYLMWPPLILANIVSVDLRTSKYLAIVSLSKYSIRTLAIESLLQSVIGFLSTLASSNVMLLVCERLQVTK